MAASVDFDFVWKRALITTFNCVSLLIVKIGYHRCAPQVIQNSWNKTNFQCVGHFNSYDVVACSFLLCEDMGFCLDAYLWKLMCLSKIKIYMLVNTLLAVYVDNKEKRETIAGLTKTYTRDTWKKNKN